MRTKGWTASGRSVAAGATTGTGPKAQAELRSEVIRLTTQIEAPDATHLVVQDGRGRERRTKLRAPGMAFVRAEGPGRSTIVLNNLRDPHRHARVMEWIEWRKRVFHHLHAHQRVVADLGRTFFLHPDREADSPWRPPLREPSRTVPQGLLRARKALATGFHIIITMIRTYLNNKAA